MLAIIAAILLALRSGVDLGVEVHIGVYLPVFYQQHGKTAVPIAAEQYFNLVRLGQCGSESSAQTNPRRHDVELTCGEMRQ